MKKLSILFTVVLAAVILIFIPRSGNAKINSYKTNKSLSRNIPYLITLESRELVDGAWEWVWSIKNNENYNAQELSHWGIVVGSCFNINDVVDAAYSFNGKSWNSFDPGYAVDPSQTCIEGPVLKFDAGTNGNKKTYYKLVVSKDYPVGAGTGYYKSGTNTGCGMLPSFAGIGDCDGDGDDGGFWTDN